VRAFGQPFDCQGWAQEVAAQVLELVAGGRGDGDLGGLLCWIARSNLLRIP
jgi:hypothetical protein